MYEDALNLYSSGGGDLAFLSCDSEDLENGGSTATKALVRNIAIGDQNGKPVAQTGWYADWSLLEKLFDHDPPFQENQLLLSFQHK